MKFKYKLLISTLIITIVLVLLSFPLLKRLEMNKTKTDIVENNENYKSYNELKEYAEETTINTFDKTPTYATAQQIIEALVSSQKLTYNRIYKGDHTVPFTINKLAEKCAPIISPYVKVFPGYNIGTVAGQAELASKEENKYKIDINITLTDEINKLEAENKNTVTYDVSNDECKLLEFRNQDEFTPAEEEKYGLSIALENNEIINKLNAKRHTYKVVDWLDKNEALYRISDKSKSGYPQTYKTTLEKFVKPINIVVMYLFSSTDRKSFYAYVDLSSKEVKITPVFIDIPAAGTNLTEDK